MGKIRFLTGDSVAVTRFSDTLTVSDPTVPNPNKLSPLNWIFGESINGNAATPLNYPSYSIGISTFDANPALLWSQIGSNNPANNIQAFLLPVPVYANLYGKSQFSQCTLVGTSGASAALAQCGLIVCCAPAACTGVTNINTGLFGYVLSVDAGHGGGLFRRGVDNESDSVNLHSFAAATFVNGDVLRLSVDRSSASQNVLTVLQNGSLLFTITDNSANRLKLGSPGLAGFIMQQSGGAVGKSDWRNFSCGLGL